MISDRVIARLRRAQCIELHYTGVVFAPADSLLPERLPFTIMLLVRLEEDTHVVLHERDLLTDTFSLLTARMTDRDLTRWNNDPGKGFAHALLFVLTDLDASLVDHGFTFETRPTPPPTRLSLVR